MAQWEYRIVDCPHTDATSTKIGGEKAGIRHQVEAIANALGADGWELVAAVDHRPKSVSAHISGGLVLTFKRMVG